MTNKPTQVKYVLFSHYAYREKDDFDAFQKGTALKDLEGVRYLKAHSRGLGELLTTPGYEGLIVLFYSPGYKEFLGRLAKGSREISAQESFASDVAAHVQNELGPMVPGDRIRFVTSSDLEPILGRANAILAAEFMNYFLGPAQMLNYDTAKVVEAILRLRVLGNGVPVLRLDYDVIFRGKVDAERNPAGNQEIGDLGLFKAVACAVRAYRLRLEKPSVSTFLFSASYNSRALFDPTSNRFESWSRAFATRIQPALIADVDKIAKICEESDETARSAEWQKYAESHLDESLAREFYGLDSNDLRLVKTKGGLTSIGAHPFHAVISGALLCLSEGAILDLPPFSNFKHNVMWIDDHLKYSLHRALNHFTSGDSLELDDPGLSDARMGEVTVTKGRGSLGSDLHLYIWKNYLPTLLLGAVMDAWITNDSILKYRHEQLPEDMKTKWQVAQRDQNQAILPAALLAALSKGAFGRQDELELKERLKASAIERIEQVRQLWGNLKTDGKTTFASYWATGTVDAVFPDRPQQPELWQGITLNSPISGRLKHITQLNPALMAIIMELIDDTVNYVHWTLAWPRLVQIVRSVQQGKFKGDLSWQS